MVAKAVQEAGRFLVFCYEKFLPGRSTMDRISEFQSRIIPVCMLIILILTACNPSNSGSVVQASTNRQEPTVSQDDLGKLVAGNNTFAFDLYQALKAEKGNLLYSPFSLSEVLSMAYAGARGDTAQQMAETLHFTLPQDRLHPAFNALDLRLAKLKDNAEPGFELNIANAVWAQKDYPILPEYLEVLALNYGAGVRLVDFENNPGDAVNKINRWVDKQTKGRIKQIVNQLDDMKIVLTNAVYFNANWDKPFKEKETEIEPFYLLDGHPVDAALMHQMDNFAYTEGDGYQAITLPYANRDFGMVILLPSEGQFRVIEEQLNHDWVQDVLQGFQTHEVKLTLPKYRFETPLIGLKDLLSSMGMSDAFSREADFSGIVDQRPIMIDDVLHKAFIEVDEKKTEAAAASAVQITESAALPEEPEEPIEMRIDRPFIFLIRDIQSGAILFVGRVMDPTQ